MNRSIFQKVCPTCMTTLPLEAKQCPCGYDYGQANTDSAPSSLEIRIKAEELYENYLAARVQQAVNAVNDAHMAFTRNPEDLERSGRVDRAVNAARDAEAALAVQSAHVAELKKSLQPAAPLKPAITTAPAPIPMAPKKRMTPPKPAAPSPVRALRKAIATVAATAVTNAKRAITVTTHTIKKENPVVLVQKKPVLVQSPVQTTIPNTVFRKAQAAKAEKILQTAQATAVVASIKKEPPLLAAEAELTKSPQTKAPSVDPVSTKMTPRLHTRTEKKECPNCTAAVTSNLVRCRCGYEFPSSEQLIPPLSMSEEERAEFAKIFTSS